MFEALSEDLRSARAPLLYGYSILVSLYWSLDGTAPKILSKDPVWSFSVRYFRSVSPGIRFALVAVLAFALGSFVGQMFLNRLVRWWVSRGNSRWNQYIAAAWLRARNYGESGSIGAGGLEMRQEGILGPSAGLEQRMWGIVARREREAQSNRFRRALVISLILPTLVAASKQSWASATMLLAVLAAALFEIRVTGNRLLAMMQKAEDRDLSWIIGGARAQVAVLNAGFQGLSEDEQSRTRARMDSLQNYANTFEAFREMLCSDPEGYFGTFLESVPDETEAD